MTVQELCDKLVEIGQQRLADILTNVDVIENTDFPEALTTEWLAKNIDAVFAVVQRKKAKQGELIGELEINAFLAAFQKMYESGRRTRVDKWAGMLNGQRKLVAEGGPLKAQMRHIGVKVEDEWLTDTVPMRASQ